MDKLRTVVSKDLVQLIISHPLGFGSFLEVEDTQIWRCTANGVFSVKFANLCCLKMLGR